MVLPAIRFIPSPNYTPTSGRAIDLVVIHDMEAPERSDTAESVARYFQTTDRDVSAHYCIDSDSIVQCVDIVDIAWCAPGSNHNGIQLEHAGYASQRADEWGDSYSTAMLELSAELTADLCKKYEIPIRSLDQHNLLRGLRGITTHAAVSRAYKRSDHTDPGNNFPMGWYLSRVKFHSEDSIPTLKPWPIPLPQETWQWMDWWEHDRRDGVPRPFAIREWMNREGNGRVPAYAWRRLRALRAARERKK